MGLSAAEREKIVEEETLRQETRSKLAHGHGSHGCHGCRSRRWLWLALAFALGLAVGAHWRRHCGWGWGGGGRGCHAGMGQGCRHGMGSWEQPMEGRRCPMGGEGNDGWQGMHEMPGRPPMGPPPAGPPPANK